LQVAVLFGYEIFEIAAKNTYFQSIRLGILPEALDCMTFEIRCCRTVLRILEAPNTMNTLEALTPTSSTGKKMILLCASISKPDIGFKEAIYC
jgi:hypothetical protein